MVHEQHRFLRPLVPGARIAGELAVILGVGAERVHQRRLVVGGAAHPAIGQPRPFGDRNLLRLQFLGRAGDAEIAMREAARAGIGRAGEDFLSFRLVQRVVEPGQRAHRIAEAGMRGDVAHPLAVDVDLAAVLEAVDVFGAGERARIVGDVLLRGHSFVSQEDPAGIGIGGLLGQRRETRPYRGGDRLLAAQIAIEGGAADREARGGGRLPPPAVLGREQTPAIGREIAALFQLFHDLLEQKER